MRINFLLLLFFVIATQLLSSCNPQSKKTDTLFELIPSSTSGVKFSNTITTNDSINILSYEYLYNGGGVGIGDFNGDGLPDMFLSAHMVPSKLYINKGNFVFEDFTAASGIDTKDVWAYGVSIIDINQDGLSDIYLCAGGMGNRYKDIYGNKLYINKGNAVFEESSKQYGLDIAGESIQATFFDYDLDGDLDMYLMKGGGFERSAITPFPIMRDGSSRNADKLYRNDFNEKDGHPFFTNVSKEAGILIEGYGLGVSVIDVNRDGWPDIYVSNDYLSKDHLYVNNRNGTFTDKVDEYFRHISHFAMGNDVGDINNDGRMDIVAVDMLPEDNYRRKLMFGPNQYDKFYYAVGQGYGYQYMRNTLQISNEDGTFSEIGQLAGIDRTNWSWAPLMADFDNDGYLDLMVSNGYGKDVTNLDYVKYRQASATLSAAERRKALLDRPSIILPNYAYRNKHDNTFENVSEKWGFDVPSISSGMAYADLDRDGDLDLVVNNIDLEAFVYRNTLMEKKTPNANFLRVRLTGPEKNREGLGAIVTLQADSLSEVRYYNPVHGFESSVENIIHFGIGKASKINSVTVQWSDGKVTTVVSPEVNTIATIAYNQAVAVDKIKEPVVASLFSNTNDVVFKHSENEFNDFLYQPLLQHKLSQEGPGIAVGDINHDGMDDIFIGGAYRLPARVFIQNAKGTFESKEFPSNLESEDMGAVFFDADNDGDEDLYVVSGGMEFYDEHPFYRDRLYKNDGKGNMINDTLALPKIYASGSCVVAGDYDADGDLDLFVGGRVMPERYPMTSKSFILNNEKGKFTDVTEQVAPLLADIGMVTSALWTDIDNDNFPDLMLAGEAMPIRIFHNKKTSFEDITVSAGLGDSDGFWNSLVGGDFDSDGDIDYVAGNLGLNGPMRASVQGPITIAYADFDNNGSVEPLIGYDERGKTYPIHSLDILTSRLPGLKKFILEHNTYAQSSLEDLIKMTKNQNYKKLYCKVLSSSFVRNNGNGTFTLMDLPLPAQVSPLYGMMAEDVNGDGDLDLLAVGNSYAPEIIYGRFDALQGLTLLGDGKGNFSPMSVTQSGFFVNGDAKGLARIETTKGTKVLVTQNNDSLKSFSLNSAVTSVKVRQDEAYGMLMLKNSRKRKVEFYFGSTYLSQSSRTVLINKDIESIELFDGSGKSTRKLSF